MKQSYCFLTDSALKIVLCDEGISELCGRTPEGLAGERYYSVFPRLYNGRKDAVSESIRGKKAVTLRNYCLRFPNGQMVADVRISPESGHGTGTNGRQHARISIRPLYTCKLAMELKHSQQLIDIGKVASILAHGVRNPLNAIKGAVVYLGEKYSEEPVLLEFTRIIQEEITRLDTFISKFLSTSISELGQESTINAILKKVEIFTTLQARSRNIRQEFAYGALPALQINSFQLEQAVLNVINNAIEAMEKGGRLSVRTLTEQVESRQFIVIEISDTGPGISEKSLSIQSGNGKKGKGFGLFITREILKSNGGRLEIKSEKGRGTTVRLCLPFEPAPGPPLLNR